MGESKFVVLHYSDPDPSGKSSPDSEAEVKDLKKTEGNKEIVRSYLGGFMYGGDTKRNLMYKEIVLLVEQGNFVVTLSNKSSNP